MKDPEKRRAYDMQWASIKRTQAAQKEVKKRQDEFAEAERKKAAEENARNQKEKDARQERLQHLERLKSKYDGDIFELSRIVRKLVVDLKRLQDQDDEELRKERDRKSWWTYVTSPFYASPKETEEEKQTREVERLQRLASKRIKERDLVEKEAKLKKWKDALEDANNKIAAEKAKAEEEARSRAAKIQEQLRREQEARRRVEQQAAEEEMRKRWEEIQTRMRQEQAARAAREAREARESQEAWEAQQRAWKVAEERRKAEEKRRAEERRQAEEKRKAKEKQRAEAEKRARAASWADTVRKAQQGRNDWFEPEVPSYSFSRASAPNKTSSVCRHEMFWPKLNGSHTCQNCHGIQRRFAFQCPGCNIIACASCRQTMRGERRRRDL